MGQEWHLEQCGALTVGRHLLVVNMPEEKPTVFRIAEEPSLHLMVLCGLNALMNMLVREEIDRRFVTAIHEAKDYQGLKNDPRWAGMLKQAAEIFAPTEQVVASILMSGTDAQVQKVIWGKFQLGIRMMQDREAAHTLSRFGEKFPIVAMWLSIWSLLQINEAVQQTAFISQTQPLAHAILEQHPNSTGVIALPALEKVNLDTARASIERFHGKIPDELWARIEKQLIEKYKGDPPPYMIVFGEEDWQPPDELDLLDLDTDEPGTGTIYTRSRDRQRPPGAPKPPQTVA